MAQRERGWPGEGHSWGESASPQRALQPHNRPEWSTVKGATWGRCTAGERHSIPTLHSSPTLQPHSHWEQGTEREVVASGAPWAPRSPSRERGSNWERHAGIRKCPFPHLSLQSCYHPELEVEAGGSIGEEHPSSCPVLQICHRPEWHTVRKAVSSWSWVAPDCARPRIHSSWSSPSGGTWQQWQDNNTMQRQKSTPLSSMRKYIKSPDQKENGKFPETNLEDTEIHSLNDKNWK